MKKGSHRRIPSPINEDNNEEAEEEEEGYDQVMKAQQKERHHHEEEAEGEVEEDQEDQEEEQVQQEREVGINYHPLVHAMTSQPPLPTYPISFLGSPIGNGENRRAINHNSSNGGGKRNESAATISLVGGSNLYHEYPYPPPLPPPPPSPPVYDYTATLPSLAYYQQLFPMLRQNIAKEQQPATSPPASDPSTTDPPMLSPIGKTITPIEAKQISDIKPGFHEGMNGRYQLNFLEMTFRNLETGEMFFSSNTASHPINALYPLQKTSFYNFGLPFLKVDSLGVSLRFISKNRLAKLRIIERYFMMKQLIKEVDFVFGSVEPNTEYIWDLHYNLSDIPKIPMVIDMHAFVFEEDTLLWHNKAIFNCT